MLPFFTAKSIGNPVIRFVPIRVEGYSGVREVAVFPDKLQIFAADKCVTICFKDIAGWKKPVCFWKWLHLHSWWRQRWVVIGSRNWLPQSKGSYITFYSIPPITIYIPDEDERVDYGSTLFRRIQDVILRGGFNTWDEG